jgi:hypothetical protein
LIDGDLLDSIRPLVAELVGALDGWSPSDAAELEQVALEGIGPFGHPALPDEVVALLPHALLERGDETAAGILAAFAELGSSPLRELAAEACDHLAVRGVTSPFAGAVGTLEVCECYRTPVEHGGELFGALLQRRGQRKAQAVALLVMHEPCGGVIASGLLGGRELLRGATKDEAIGRDELAETLRSALAHMVEHSLALDADYLPALLLLERALTGRAGGWPRPALAGPNPKLDEEALVEEFADEHGDEAALVADLLCDWKRDYAEAPFDHWTVGDLHEFLLDWYPRKGYCDDESLAAVPGSIVAFLAFLDELDRLSGDPLATLIASVEQLRAPFERAARDPRNWGPAKAMVMRMRAEGVDPAEPGALEAWVAGFNARPFEERDRVLAPSLPRPAPRSVQRRKAQRRTTKTSRKRNRR